MHRQAFKIAHCRDWRVGFTHCDTIAVVTDEWDRQIERQKDTVRKEGFYKMTKKIQRHICIREREREKKKLGGATVLSCTVYVFYIKILARKKRQQNEFNKMWLGFLDMFQNG